MDKVFLDGIKATASHGVLESEKAEPQPFEIDLAVYGDFRNAGIEDDLGLAVDYSLLGNLVIEVVTANRFSLIEAMAEAIAEKILSLPLVLEVEVTVKKMKPPVSFALNYAAVKVRRGFG
ncbi:MAG: dihydroneopterin aldolase [Acidimicrobiaceae bacterium]|nr:dihydroneopterin aldolase [Acidimicrobiaceae bacterium]